MRRRTTALVAAALVGLIAFLVMSPDGDGPSTEASTPSASSSSAAAPTTEETEQPAATTPATTSPVDQPEETPAPASVP